VVGPGGGAATTFATGLSSPQGLAFDALGNLYVTDAGLAEVLMYGPGGGSSPVVDSSGGYASPEGLAFTPVPEPSALALLGVGAVALAGYCCRRSQLVRLNTSIASRPTSSATCSGAAKRRSGIAPCSARPTSPSRPPRPGRLAKRG
jgi:hypothetical protein